MLITGELSGQSTVLIWYYTFASAYSPFISRFQILNLKKKYLLYLVLGYRYPFLDTLTSNVTVGCYNLNTLCKAFAQAKMI